MKPFSSEFWRRKFLDDRGFSIVEIILIILVLSVAMLPISKVLQNSTISLGHSISTTRSLVFAEKIMQSIYADYNAEQIGRGYTWVTANWPGQVPNPPSGLSGTVLISDEQTFNLATYVTVRVIVTEPDRPDVTLTGWLVKDVGI